MILETLKQANSAMLDSIQVTTNKQAAKIFKEQVKQLGEITAQLEKLLNIIIIFILFYLAPVAVTTADSCAVISLTSLS